MNQLKQLALDGGLPRLIKCLEAYEKVISASSLRDQKQEKQPSSQVKSHSSPPSFQQIQDLFYGSTTKSRETKSCCDVSKQVLESHKQNCSPTSINIKLPLTIMVDKTLKSSIPPTSIEDRLNNFARSLTHPLLFLIKLTKSKDSLMTAKTSDLGQFIFGLENLQKHTALLLEYVKLMRQEKENDG